MEPQRAADGGYASFENILALSEKTFTPRGEIGIPPFDTSYIDLAYAIEFGLYRYKVKKESPQVITFLLTHGGVNLVYGAAIGATAASIAAAPIVKGLVNLVLKIDKHLTDRREQTVRIQGMELDNLRKDLELKREIAAQLEAGESQFRMFFERMAIVQGNIRSIDISAND